MAQQQQRSKVGNKSKARRMARNRATGKYERQATRTARNKLNARKRRERRLGRAAGKAKARRQLKKRHHEIGRAA
jgi:hypothetical protein